MAYVYSDPHFGHSRLREFGRPEFETDEEMHRVMVERYNSVIINDDMTVYWLGDLGNKKFIEEFLPKMRGNKILILGNHDTYSKSFYQQFFNEVHVGGIFYSKRILLTHHPVPVEPGMINVHGHTHLIDVASGQHFNVCVERTGYLPVRMKKFEQELSNMEKPNRKFMQEWYKDIQKPATERDDLILTDTGLIDVPKTIEHWKSIKPERVMKKFIKDVKKE